MVNRQTHAEGEQYSKKGLSKCNGLQDTLLQQNFSRDIPTSEFVQVLCVNGNNWI